MKKILLILSILFIGVGITSASTNEDELNFDTIVKIYDIGIDTIKGVKLDYELLAFDSNIDIKYLLSGNLTYKVEGEGFTGNQYNSTLLLSVNNKYYANSKSNPKNDYNNLYFNSLEKRYVILESATKFFKFKFCPYSKKEGFGKCAYSNAVQIKVPNSSNDLYSKMQYYLRDMKISNAKKIVKNNIKNTVTIAVIDDGIKLDNKDLEGNYWKNSNEIEGNGIDDDNNGYIDDVAGWNFIDGTGSIIPKGGHGTIVSSIIGAKTDNKIGISGITNNVKIMPIITCAKKSCKLDNINKSIIYAADNGANIIYLNTGNIWFEYDDRFSKSIEYANNKGITIVMSAGNGDESLKEKGINTTTHKISPVCNEKNKHGVIGVSSMSLYSDKMKHGLKSSWSNYGDCSDVSAYGEGIISLSIDTLDPNNKNNTKEDVYRWGYTINEGNSYSAAIITGIIGLGYNKHGYTTSKSILEALNYSYDKIHGIDTEKYIIKIGELKMREKIENIKKEKTLSENKKEVKNIQETNTQKEKNKKEEYKKKVLKILGNKLNKISIEKLKIISLKILSLSKKEGISETRLMKINIVLEVLKEHIISRNK